MIEFTPEIDIEFQPDFDELTPPYVVECPACGEGPFESLAEEKHHARLMHTQPVSKFREYMDTDMGFFEQFDAFNEQLEQDTDPSEIMADVIDDFTKEGL